MKGFAAGQRYITSFSPIIVVFQLSDLRPSRGVKPRQRLQLIHGVREPILAELLASYAVTELWSSLRGVAVTLLEPLKHSVEYLIHGVPRTTPVRSSFEMQLVHSIAIVGSLAILTVGRRQHTSPETLKKKERNEDEERESWDAMFAHSPASSSLEIGACSVAASPVNSSSPIPAEWPFKNSD